MDTQKLPRLLGYFHKAWAPISCMSYSIWLIKVTVKCTPTITFLFISCWLRVLYRPQQVFKQSIRFYDEVETFLWGEVSCWMCPLESGCYPLRRSAWHVVKAYKRVYVDLLKHIMNELPHPKHSFIFTVYTSICLAEVSRPLPRVQRSHCIH